jgi:hypothetical protein
MKSILGWTALVVMLAAFSAACGGKDKPPLTPDSDLDAGIGDMPVAPATK